MKIVTICGSMKFADEMQKTSAKLQIENGWCVLQPVYVDKSKDISIDGLNNLKEAHFKKIEISDAIYVLNINGYVGDSTKGEIGFAKKHNKEVIYHEKI